MKPAKLLREIAFPVTDLAVMLAMIGFLLLAKLAAAAGFLGLFLAIILVPAFFRYLLYILEARVANRDVPALAAELFSLVENFWSLFPLVLIAIVIWGSFYFAVNASVQVALVFGLSVAILFPASMTVLAITRSPVQSLSPTALFTLIRLCGLDYVLIFVVIAVMGMVPAVLAAGGMPDFLIDLAGLYIIFLLFTFTGAVVADTGANAMISIPEPLEPTVDEIETRAQQERATTLSHAYGFVSRNDRAGGFAHLQRYIDAAPDPKIEYDWFFSQMLNWEIRDHALFFAQRYLSYLLDAGHHIAAMKLIARCRLENARFRPLPEDLERALEAAKRLQNDELVQILSAARHSTGC
jgi:hypothetical protein